MNSLLTSAAALLVLALQVSLSPRATAAVPLPDHVVFGTIAIDGKPVTGANTDTVIEARRSADGPILASYRMGTSLRLGNFYYALRLPIAAVADARITDAVLGDSVIITVRNQSGTAHQVVHTVTEPGVALRLDFGASVDTNGDGVPDGWELATLGTTGANLSLDTDADGVADRGEYVAGTRPVDASDVFRLAVQNDGAVIRVSCRALRAVGTGYESRTRYYSLEFATDPVSGPWQSIENLSRIPGADQLVIYEQPADTEVPVFFRARVWLE